MDPSENYKKLNDATKVVDLYAAAQDKNQFMDQLVADKFLVKDPNLSRTANIWEHFGVFSSTNTPEFSFGKEYGKIFSNYKVPNKLFWKNYVGQIQDYLGYLSSVRPQIAQFKNGATDQLIRVYGERSGLTAEQIAYLQNLQGQQKADFVDQIIKGLEPKKTQFYGSGGKPQGTQGKGIQGAQRTFETTHPEIPLSEAGSKGIQGGQETYTISHPEIKTSGPTQPLPSLGRQVLTDTSEQPLREGMEVLRSSNTSNQSGFGKSGSFFRRILHPAPEVQEAQNETLSEAKFQLEMGAKRGLPALGEAAKDFGGEILKEVESVPAFSREPQETVVYDTPQETTYTSTGGGRFSPGGRNIRVVRNVPRTIRRTKKGITGARLATTGIKQVATKNPYSIAAIVVLMLLGLLTVGMMLDTSNIYKNTALCGPDVPCGKGGIPDIVTTSTLLTVFKGGDDKVENGADITYNITVEYVGPGTASIDLNDAIPSNTSFDPAKQFPSFTGTFNSGNVNWHFDNLSINKPIQVFLVLTPTCQDCYVDNTATAVITKTSGYLGGGDNLMPAPLPDPPPNWDAIVARVMAALQANPASIVAYQEAQAVTGVPWQLIAGIHFQESGMRQTTQTVNGHDLGVAISDLTAAQCASNVTPGLGIPVPAPGGGCTFTTLLSSAVYSGYFLVNEKNFGQPIVTFQDAVGASARYNGMGNSNCQWPDPYKTNGNCTGPDIGGREFPGEDHPYAMSDFDAKHYEKLMYVIFCTDGNATPTGCRTYDAPGVMAVLRAIATASP